MVDEPPVVQPESARYCRRCGSRFASNVTPFCATCGARWSEALPVDSVDGLVRLIEEVQRWHLAGTIDAGAYGNLTTDLEARLARLSPPSAAVVPRAGEVEAPPRTPAVPRVSLRQWASERQADLLLYVGAFLLVAAALLFVGGSSDRLSPVVRLGVLGAYTIAFAAVGLLVPRWERVREAGPVFLALGALLAPLNVVFWYTEVLQGRGVPDEWVWLFGSLAATGLYGTLYFRGFGAPYRILAGIAAINAWEALFAIGEANAVWLAPWHMLLALLIASAGARFRVLTNGLVASAATTAGLALLGALASAALDEGERAQFPVTVALLTLLIAVVGAHRGWPAFLPAAAASTTATVVALLWAVDVKQVWWAYAPLVLAIVTLATRPRWAPRSAWLARSGWLFATAAAVSTLLLYSAFEGTWHGGVVLALASAVVVAVTWLSGVTREGEPVVPTSHRVALGWVACALLLVAVRTANAAAALESPDTTWPYLGVASLVALAFGWLVRSRSAPALVPPFLIAVLLAQQPPALWPGHDAIALGVSAVELLLCARLGRSWFVATLGAVLGGGALAATWAQFEWPAWTLSLIYAACGWAWFAGTSRWRNYEASTDFEAYRQVAVLATPVVLVAAAFAVALSEAEPASIEVMAQAAWYRVLIVLLVAIAAAFLYEAWGVGVAALTLPAAALLAASLALGWPVLGAPRLWLAPAYAAAGLALLGALLRWRRGTDVAGALTWGFAGIALLVAWDAVPEDSRARLLVASSEYRVLVVLVLLTAAEVAFESRRLRSALGSLAASAIAMTGVLLAIAIAEPANIQAFTIPAAAYLLGVGLLVGRRPYPLLPHLLAHEALLIAGALTLVLPPAEQSFEAGGSLWGLVVLLEGFALLLDGLVLSERWLATAGVLSMSGVAVRWLVTEAQTVPYWATLGIAGLVLLGLGLLLLFQREWWERVISAVGEWWRRPRVEAAP